MDGRAFIVLTIFLLLSTILFGFWVYCWIVVVKTAPAAEVRRITVGLEGIIGEAGPLRTALEIRHVGGGCGYPSYIFHRDYLATLKRPDGRVETRPIQITYMFLSEIAMSVGEPEFR